MASDVAQHVTGPLAVWQIEGGPAYDEGITETALATELQLALANPRDGIGRQLLISADLEAALDAETNVGGASLEVGQVRPADAMDELLMFSGVEVSQLLHLQIARFNGEFGVIYRVLDLNTGTLVWAGSLWERGGPDGVEELADLALSVSAASAKIVVPMFVQSVDRAAADLSRRLVTTSLARRFPYRVMDFEYYERTLTDELSDAELGAFQSGRRSLLPPIRNGLQRIGAEDVLFIQSVEGSFIGTLLEGQSARVILQEVRGGTASQLAQQLEHTTSRISEDGPAFGRARVLPVASSGTTSLSPADQLALRSTIQAQLAAGGIEVVDFETVEAVGDDDPVRIGADSEVKSIVDPAGLHMYVSRDTRVVGVYTSIREPRLAQMITSTYDEYLTIDQPTGVGVLSVDAASLEGLAEASKLATHLFVLEQFYEETPVLDPAVMITRASSADLGSALSADLPGEIATLARAEDLPQAVVRIATVDALGGADLHVQVIDLPSAQMKVSRSLLLSTSITQDIARGLAPRLDGLPDDAACVIAPVYSVPANAAPEGLRYRLESIISSQLGWPVAPSEPGTLDNARAQEVFNDVEEPLVFVQPYFWQIRPGEFSILLRFLQPTGGRPQVTKVVSASFDSAGRVGSSVPLDAQAEAALETAVRVVGGGDVVKAFTPEQRLAGIDPVLFGTLLQARMLGAGASLVDTPFPSAASAFDAEQVVYLLGAQKFVMPYSYNGEDVGVRVYDTQGYLDTLTLPPLDGETAAAIQQNPPPLRPLESAAVVLDYTFEQADLDAPVIQDIVLAELLSIGSLSVVDRINSETFLAIRPDNVSYEVSLVVADSPFYGTPNPTLETRVRYTQDSYRPIVWASATPLVGTAKTLRPGGYIDVDLDQIASQIAFNVQDTREYLELEVVRVILEPSAITLDAEPNRILRERFADPVQSIIDKTAAELHRLGDGYYVYDTRVRGLSPDERQQVLEVQVTITEAGTVVDPEQFIYRQTFNGLCRVVEPDGTGLPIRLEEEGEIPQLELRERMLVFDFRLLADLDEQIELGRRYAESGQLEDLQNALTAAERLSGQVAELGQEASRRDAAIQELRDAVQALTGERGLQAAINQAVRAIGNEDYREAQRILRAAEREYGESDAITRLLEEAENLPRGVVASVRHPEGQSFDPAAVGSAGLTEFAIEGELPPTPAPQFLELSFTNTGLFHVAAIDGAVDLEIPDEHSLETSSGTYIIARTTREPIPLVVRPQEAASAQTAWTLSLELDNEVIYRAFPDTESVRRTFPGIAVDYDVDTYKLRRKRIQSGTGWFITSVLAGAGGAAAWWGYSESIQPRLVEAIAAYNGSQTSTEAQTNAEDATRLSRLGTVLRILNYTGYGVAGLSAFISALTMLSVPTPPDITDVPNLFGQ